VILDVDGTLVDSNDAHARSWVQAFAEHGITVAYEDVRRAIGMGGDKLMPLVSGIQDESDEGRRIASRRAEIFAQVWLPGLRAFPRTRELLQRFGDDGFTLAVASSAKKDELTLLLQTAGVSDLISQPTSSDDASSSKPDPDIVQAAMKRTGCAPGHAVMVGDTPYDIEAARRAGLFVVAFECGGWNRAGLGDADEVYRDPGDLLGRYDTSVFARMRAVTRRSSG
jgi:HAD superfamily hydrolase (TIGR01549 family)